jgi:pilin isopeptide linkage protein
MPTGSSGGAYDFSITGTGSFSIPSITFPHVGMYTYELKHVTAARTGYTYDTQAYTMEVYITNNSNPVVITRGKNNIKASVLSFSHKYSALPSLASAMTNPSVVKSVSGNPPSAATFSFSLTAASADYPMPSGSSGGVRIIRVVGAGSAKFGTWTYTKSGTYRYTVKERNTGVTGYTYSTEVYTITDTVKDTNGRLAITRVITNKAGSRVTSMRFVNTYRAPTTPTVVGPVTPPTVTPVTPPPTENPSDVTETDVNITEPPEEPEQIVPEEPVVPPTDSTITDDPTPLAQAPVDQPVQGGAAAWALLNLILAVTGVICAILFPLEWRRRERREERERADCKGKGRTWLIFCLVFAVASVIVFILTEDMRLPMIWVDKWTIVNAVLLALGIIAGSLGLERPPEEYDDEDALPGRA